jgi:Cu-Zn family superoxide dismutase
LAAAIAVEAAHAAGAEIKDAGANVVATAELQPTGAGVWIKLQATVLPAGVHGFHIHETGECSPPDFTSAGDHFDPADTEHGFLAEMGPHAGDMPNIHVPESGELTVEIINPMVVLEPGHPRTLFDADGSALVIHDGPDDFSSQPAGDAGSRIACGVIEE